MSLHYGKVCRVLRWPRNSVVVSRTHRPAGTTCPAWLMGVVQGPEVTTELTSWGGLTVWLARPVRRGRWRRLGLRWPRNSFVVSRTHRRLTRPVTRGWSASSRPSSACRSVTHHGPPTRSSIGVASASLPPCCIVCSVVACGSLSPSVTLYSLHQSLLLSTLVYLQYIHVHLQYRSTRSTLVLITFHFSTR